MRILHCIPGLGGGGAERQLVYLAGESPNLGWDTHVAFVWPGPNLPALEETGAGIHRLRVSGNHDVRLVWLLRRLVRALRPDVVQTWLTQMDVLGGLVARGSRTPWVLTERTMESAYPTTLKNLTRVGLARWASAVVANSSGGKAYWRHRVRPDVPRYVVPNALPLARIRAAPPASGRDLGVPADVDVVLFVGRLAPEKDLPTLLEALARLLPGRPAVAVVLGDGPARGSVAGEVDRMGLSGQVFLPGYVPDVWRWMKRARLMIATSTFEGSPNAVLEAMACGCPLVVSDIAAHREILDDDTALFARVGDAEAFAAAAAHVLDSPAAAAPRASAARRRAERWSTGTIAAEYDRIYRRVLGCRAAPAVAR